MFRSTTNGEDRARGRTVLTLLTVLAVAPGGVRGEICPVEYRAGQLEHWAGGSIFYQVFVRSFQDSDGDGIGDFNGLASRLDYLNDGDPGTDTDLGVDAIWMLPITESPSYHGYDTLNYDRVEKDYGSEADFDRLIAEAHNRGIRVIMDLVVNHSSAWHPWFIQANQSTTDSFHDWYVWRQDDPGWTQPWSASQTWHKSHRLPLYYYGLFWGGMPDLNFENPEVRAEMIAVARRWLARGLDGFRLDASRHIIEAGEEAKVAGSPETHAWWMEFAREVRRDFPDAIFVGENWTTVDEVAPFFGDEPFTQLDMNFNFDLAAAIVGGVRDDTPGLIQTTLCDVADYYPAHALDATFLTNHDMIRVATQVRRPERARLAASLLFTLPGVPFIYYGEEVGLVNGPGDEDPEKRTPMPWTDGGGFTTGTPWIVNRRADPQVNVARQQADPGSLWHHYRALINLRKKNAALARGGYRPLEVSGDAAGDAIAWERYTDDDRLVVVANFSDSALKGLTIEVNSAGDGAVEVLFGAGGGVERTGDGLLVTRLGPRSVMVFRVHPAPQAR
jgi:glycosidase